MHIIVKSISLLDSVRNIVLGIFQNLGPAVILLTVILFRNNYKHPFMFFEKYLPRWSSPNYGAKK